MSSSFPIGASILLVAACMALVSAQGQDSGPKQAPLIVWSGDNPQGKTWSQLGPKGSIRVEDGAGLKGAKGLVLHLDGKGWRGGGVNWKGWYPADAATDASQYTALVFHIRQVTKVDEADLQVGLVDNVKRADNASPGNLLSLRHDGGLEKIDGTWRRVVLPLSRFANNKPLKLDRLWQVDFSNQGSDELIFQIDQIGFAIETAARQRFAGGPTFQAEASVDCGKAMHPINDGIYGVCGLSRDKLAEYRIPVTRWGGNASTRYNWKLGVDNGAADWYFMNRGKLLERSIDNAYVKHIESNQSLGATIYQTIPMIGWVAKDNHSYAWSVKKYGPQKAHEPGNADAGNGVRPDGSLLTGNDPRDTSVLASPDFVAEAVRLVVKRAGPPPLPGAGEGREEGVPGVRYWVLDNEPMLWHTTHRDVRPKPLGYDELWERTVQYAEAIRKADPSCKIAGFCSWGWTDLFYSAQDEGKDRYASKPDWQAHGKVPLAEWYIMKCGEYRKKHGRPLVDVFDFHWYPQGQVKGQGVYLGRGADTGLNALRLRSTRDLWDTTYQPESWIASDKNAPTAVIPRIQKWIAKHNPGMELSIGEYNFSGSDNITGGLAQAECFGLFARHRLDLAFIWQAPEGTQELAWQLFRSYDGNKGRFGEKYLHSVSGHADLAVFAARRNTDGAVTIVVINKNLHGSCDLDLDIGKVHGAMRIWRFDQDTENRVSEVKGDAAAVNAHIRLTLPAASASMLVILQQWD
jgi:Glycoside hydrolase family 44